MRKYGFAIVTLQCSLIDTLAKFTYGKEKQRSKERFETFLNEYFLFGYDSEELAKKIYKDIRCGIVHEGTTDNKSGLSAEMIELVSVLPNGAISLDLIILQRKLKKYFDIYKEKLKDEEEYKLRKNFVYAMDIVCKA